jgi:hypothetical protein
MDPDAALACFTDRDRWPAELREYAYNVSFPRQTAVIDAPEISVRTVRLPDARVHATLALLDFTVVPTLVPRFRDERIERARHSLDRALALDRHEYLGLLLTLSQTKIDDGRYREITDALVAGDPDDWRAWVARAWTPGLPAADVAKAIDRAWTLAPRQTEVIRLAALRALVEAKWVDARALGTKAWLGGATDPENRAVLFLAAGMLGKCDEARKWSAPRPDADAFAAKMASLQQGLGVHPPPCPAPSIPDSKLPGGQ